MSALVIVTSPEELAVLVRRAVAEELDARGIVPSTPPRDAEPAPMFARVADAAALLGVSERRCWQLVREGMPTVGVGRGRRVDIERARAWMRAQEPASDERIAERARIAANRARTRKAEP